MRIVWFGDGNIPSGFGRISDEICTRLVHRGHEICSVSLLWDGVMTEDWYSPLSHKKPFHIAGVAGRDPYSLLYNIINMANPDIVVSCQDFPYAQNIYFGCRIDWSRRAMVIITPIDGEPIFEDWLQLVDDADGTLVISEFGVAAMKRAGRRVGLCPPGIDHKYFTPPSPEDRQALRAKAGIKPDAFLLGMMAMNQGRKDIPHTLDGFWKFAIDKDALLLMDMEKASPAGWDIPKLMKTKGIPESRVIFKEDLVKRGLSELKDRFSLLDAHSVLAHREGFGLPLVESMSMGIPTIAMDWCSGTEICGDGKGYLVKTLPQSRNSTWGGACDYDPDVEDFARILDEIYNHPEIAKGIAAVGQEWARKRSWDIAADNAEQVLIQAKRRLDARLSRNSSVQPVAQSPQVGTVDPHPSAKEGEGNSVSGRLQPGLQPGGIGGTSILGRPESDQPGLRENGERGSQDREPGRPDLIPE